MPKLSVLESPQNLSPNRKPLPEIPGLLAETAFRRVLCRERRRSERSRKAFVLLLLRAKGLPDPSLLQSIAGILDKTVRETDTLGWFQTHLAIGVICAELGDSNVAAAINSIEAKTLTALRDEIGVERVTNLELSAFVFPDVREDENKASSFHMELYPDLWDACEKKRVSLVTKRIIDVIGSACALILLSPIFLVLAILIKLTSSGPVFFRQERVGQFGVPFIFLKFRSMRVSTDPSIHRDYVLKFIGGRGELNTCNRTDKSVYKITNDPRITRIGHLMRRTSLDEIPQFWNVLVGEMSLVGPRPPISYEIEAYDVWHRRRLFEVKPGITGPWQVRGRSRTTFNEMVRLDLQYSQKWSPWSDIKILCQTPRAVFSGDGAY
jgi:lipopolysaccharide/colanic/teichoic acid biosynthesis glycosyltransferase